MSRHILECSLCKGGNRNEYLPIDSFHFPNWNGKVRSQPRPTIILLKAILLIFTLFLRLNCWAVLIVQCSIIYKQSRRHEQKGTDLFNRALPPSRIKINLSPFTVPFYSFITFLLFLCTQDERTHITKIQKLLKTRSNDTYISSYETRRVIVAQNLN